MPKLRGIVEGPLSNSKVFEEMALDWDITPDTVHELKRWLDKGAKIEFLCLSRTQGKHYPKCEASMVTADGKHRCLILKQAIRDNRPYGKLHCREADICPEELDDYENERDDYIAKVYQNETWKVTQCFLARMFDLKQSRISQILQEQGVRHKR